MVEPTQREIETVARAHCVFVDQCMKHHGMLCSRCNSEAKNIISALDRIRAEKDG
jgi:hypothetical protein